MSGILFTQNNSIGLGVEVEIQIVDNQTGDLKPLGLEILEELKDARNSVRGKAEIFQSMLELDTPICENAFQAGDSLRQSLQAIRKLARAREAQIIMAGTHPFANYSDRLLSPSGRYYSLIERNRWIAKRLQIFGLHVHLGMKSGDHAIAMNNALCHYLPLFLALSASSPFWHREDTGLASSRITFFEAIPTGGHPYLLSSWSAFENLIDKLVISKSITSIKDLWWDIRPNPEFGTIEVRIADCPPTMREVQALVALIHTIAGFIDAELESGLKFSPPPEWVLRENKWRASRYGVECDLIENAEGVSRPFLPIWNETCSAIRPVIARFGYESEFKFLSEVLERGPSYRRQRDAFDGNFKSIVDHLSRENESDRPEWKPT
ncbi:MAG: YbdK family carboxylate-amine ligase [Bdellovibrionaceae bacterium]|nr:YbdK family carboxylate-amine ligase [Pseudobdellovibrionaceae bacterium]